MNSGTRNGSGRRGLWWVLALVALFSLALFMAPAFVIRPFRYQSPGALVLAIAVKRLAPALTAVALAGALALSVRLWSGASKWRRTGIAAALLLSTASAVMVRQNYFEWMFQPIKAAGFMSAGEARLSGKEMVMAVRVGPEARAYPIAQMAYHHILNDTVAGVPIAVTY
jgi:Protein of unknown function (DUF3179)